ncbi:hypothetical protein KGP36_01680 [Patescibacteria group bacterium]|nr:hypothetical protein [Patescibacteria group bacterium]
MAGKPKLRPTEILEEYDLLDWLWPMIWREDKPLELKFSDGTPAIFHKGDRVIFPKQLEFFEAMFEYRATLFGGAKAGGKSRTMLRLICIYLMILAKSGHPGANGAIFCETFKACWDRFGTDIMKGRHFPAWMGEFNQQHMVFRAHPEYGGWTVEFRNTIDFEDVEKSTQYAIIGIDESTNQEEAFFNHIGTCMRWTTDGVPVEHCPILLATNPVGMGLAWHKTRFVNPETRDREEWDEVTGIMRKGHFFIQSLPVDNPTNSKAYLSELLDKPPKVRDAFYFGLWDVFEGQFFDLDERVHSIRPFVTPYEWSYTLSLDFGFGHTACALVTATDFEGTTYVIDGISVKGLTSEQMKEQMRQQFVFKDGKNKGKMYPFAIQVADPDLFKNTGTISGRKSAIEIWNSPTLDEAGNQIFRGFRFIPANNSRKAGWGAMRDGFHYDFEEQKDKTGRTTRVPLSLPGIRIFSTLTELWSSLTVLEHRANDPDDVEKTVGVYGPGEGDDEADALRYNIMACRKGEFGAGSGEDYSDEGPPLLGARRIDGGMGKVDYGNYPSEHPSIWV